MKVVYGNDDVAGRNMSYFLEKNFAVDVIALKEHPIYHDYPEKEVGARKGELIIIPSQHKSLKNIRSLTVHAAGNFDTNDYGGAKNKMTLYDGKYARGVLMNINKYAKGLNFEVTYEATHHGPYSENPLVFVEIGSSDLEYGDKEIGYMMARAIYESYGEEAEIPEILLLVPREYEPFPVVGCYLFCKVVRYDFRFVDVKERGGFDYLRILLFCRFNCQFYRLACIGYVIDHQNRSSAQVLDYGISHSSLPIRCCSDTPVFRLECKNIFYAKIIRNYSCRYQSSSDDRDDTISASSSYDS